MKFGTRLVVALAASLSMLSPSAAFVAAEDTNAAPLVVMTLNVHGSEDRYGGGNRGKTRYVARDVLSLVAANQPTVIGFQEMCGSQYRDLRAKLAQQGYAGTFTVTRRSGGCHDGTHGNQFGNAVFVKGQIESRSSYGLPWGANAKDTPGREPRRLVCVKVKGQDLRACSIHLSTRNPDRAAQSSKVHSIIRDWTGHVVVAGDFNMAGVYVSRTFVGFSVVGSGIDYIVSTTGSTVGPTVEVRSSDHPAQFATVG